MGPKFFLEDPEDVFPEMGLREPLFIVRVKQRNYEFNNARRFTGDFESHRYGRISAIWMVSRGSFINARHDAS
jgi:hypothetical protein